MRRLKRYRRIVDDDSVERSWASSPAIRKSMRSNRGRDTKPELAVRSAVHRRGLRFRISERPLVDLRRTADLVFRKARIAVFVDGCYWHGCPLHHTRPVTNREFWADKIASNIARDADTNTRLEAAGWVVLRFWEHEDPEVAADIVQERVRSALQRLDGESVSAGDDSDSTEDDFDSD